MYKFASTSVLAASLMVSLSTAQAHSRWLLPSHTSVSGEQAPTITVDSSISNDIFHPDMALGGDAGREVPARLANLNKTTQLVLTSPDGKDQVVPLHNFLRKSVAAVDLVQSGTYRLALQSAVNTMTTYKDAQGERKRFPGSKAQAQAELPDTITELSTQRVRVNVATYVTRNDVSTSALQPTGQGLELAGIQHPNDLFVGESATFQLLLDGKPAPAGVEVKAVRGGTRHRNARQEMQASTDEQGKFSFDWPQAGFYLLEASLRRPLQNTDADKEFNGLYITIEVNPE